MSRFVKSLLTVPLLLLPLWSYAEEGPEDPESFKHVNQHDLPWSDGVAGLSADGTRWRTLLGTGGAFGEGLPDKDLYVLQGEMDPGSAYPPHYHPSAELWYFVSGMGKWQVDGEEFIAEPGSTVYLEPGSVNSVEIISKDKADIVRVNWGINCDRSVLTDKQYVFLGNRNWPQTARAFLPAWDYAGDNSRQPVKGNSNLAPPISASSSVHLKHLNFHDVRWPGRDTKVVMRWITLVGSSGGSWGEGLPNQDILFGVGEIGSEAVYDDHHHDVPEFYYFISGRAKERIDGDDFIATPGELVYHKPWAVHRTEVVSSSGALVLWADWGIDCDRTVLKEPYSLQGQSGR